jgi:hypothetical protein
MACTTVLRPGKGGRGRRGKEGGKEEKGKKNERRCRFRFFFSSSSSSRAQKKKFKKTQQLLTGLRQDDVGGGARCVRGPGNGDTHVGPLERRRVVHAVARHPRREPRLPQRLDDQVLVLREDLRKAVRGDDHLAVRLGEVLGDLSVGAHVGEALGGGDVGAHAEDAGGLVWEVGVVVEEEEREEDEGERKEKKLTDKMLTLPSLSLLFLSLENPSLLPRARSARCRP